MFCNNCGNEFSGRSDARYCGSSCKNEYYKKHSKNNNLSDSVGLSNQIEVYSPVVRQSNYNTDLSRRITNNVLGGITGGFSNTLADGVSQLTDVNNNFYQTLSMLAGVIIGGYIGYSVADKKDKWDKWICSAIGAGVGFYGSQILYNLYSQFIETSSQRQILTQQQAELQNNQLVTVSDSVSYTAGEIKHLVIPSLKFDGVWGNFLNDKVNLGFSMCAYGAPGGGKSHFATLFSNYLSKIGKVLYVIAEESMTSSVQDRNAVYEMDKTNTEFLITVNSEKVFERINDVKFVVIDSINGMLNYNYHSDFLDKLKSYKNLYGIIIINQVNKDGTATGKNEFLHKVDIIIKVDSGVATVEKNRFQAVGKSINIFPKQYSISNKIAVSQTGKLIGN